MASRNSKNSSGLRILWIPGGRSNPKGRFGYTNKQVSYTSKQKKNEVWSLGGSKAQQNLLQADLDINSLDGPSTSGLSSLTCCTAASGATAVAVAASSSTQCLEFHNSPDAASDNSNLYNKQLQNQQQHSPSTPNSSTSTAPIVSPPQSPLDQNALLNNNLTQPSTTSDITTTSTTTTMPAKHHQPIPVIITATTTADIMEENRFSLLAGKDIVTNELDIYTLPSPPIHNLDSQEHLNHSSGTTLSQLTPSGSPHKTNNESRNGSLNNSPVKKNQQPRNHNNNQGDVNSIESITEDAANEKIPTGDLDWIDNINKSQKKKNKQHGKELDQLDGVPIKNTSADKSNEEEDEKVVRCLYYTLMCCDCTIS